MLQNNSAPTVASAATAASKPAQIFPLVENLTGALRSARGRISFDRDLN
jgi:hypothetical protein